MKKEEIVQQLEAAKTLTSQVDIDKVIALINQIKTPTKLNVELANEITNRIERALDHCDDLADTNSAEFDLDYDNRIQLTRVDIDVYSIMQHVVAIVDEYIELEDDGMEDIQGEVFN